MLCCEVEGVHVSPSRSRAAAPTSTDPRPSLTLSAAPREASPVPFGVRVAAPPLADASGRVAKNAMHLFLGQGATTCLSMVLSAMLGRFLGSADFGVLYLVTSMCIASTVFLEWGQSVHLVREVAREGGSAGILLGSGVAFRVLSAVAVAVVGSALAALLGYDGRTRLLFLAMLLGWLLLSVGQAFGTIFRGRERMDADALVTVVTKVLTVALTVPALVLGGRLVSVIVAQAVAAALALGFAFSCYRRLRLPRIAFSSATVRNIAVNGTPIAAMSIAVVLQVYVDAVVLSKLSPVSVVGWYGAAKNIMNALIMPAAILGSASFPAFSRLAHAPRDLGLAVRASLRPLLGLAALGAVGTYLFADFAISVVYSRAKFGPSAAILQVFAPALLLLYTNVLLSMVVFVGGKAKLLAASKVLAVLVGTGLELLWIPVCQARWGNGALGVVAAFGVSELIMLAASLALAPRGSIGLPVLVDGGRALLAGAATLVAVRALPSTWSPLVQLPCCLLGFAGFAAVSGLLSRADLQVFRGMLGRRQTAPGVAP